MSFYIQHGYGKAQKIQSVSERGALAGVILSPGDEDPSNLRSTADYCQNKLGVEVRVDPQTYIYSTSPRGVARNHGAHGIEFSNLHWSEDARQVTAQVAAVRSLNESLALTGAWIAPTVFQSSFADVWTPLSLQMARTASDEWGEDRTIATLAVDETALDTWSGLDDWLDVATTLRVRGFYILISRANTSYPPVAWSVDRLTNLMRLIYNLSVLNNYEIHWGYSDSEGLLGICAGAHSISSGWNFSLRQFNPSKWQPTESSARRPATMRLHVKSLWSAVRGANEAGQLFESSLQGLIFTPEMINEFTAREFNSVTRAESQEQFMQVLSLRAQALSQLPLLGRIEQVEGSLRSALDLFGMIEEAGIVLEARYRPRLEAMRASLARFRESESL